MKKLIIGFAILASASASASVFATPVITAKSLPSISVEGKVAHYVSDDSMEQKDPEVQANEINETKERLSQELIEHVQIVLRRSVYKTPVCVPGSTYPNDNSEYEIIKCSVSFY